MGVPKFARFLCERYPCILEVLNEYQIPEFDNLYLDMNGIIHCCSHPNDADAHFRISEETIFKNIFLYVEILFRTIKPQKLFFMAVDGVAPRAKINQQRSRRFRSAKEAAIAEARAREKGETIPEGARFDSNCITPGTEFMTKLTEQLNYFVTYKVSTDNLWKKCKIILSGPEVPGEGEHKIMDYIRYMKAQPKYDSNTRHCLYGLDADLIMLGLCTHEPHFAVLREEVKYGRNQQKTTSIPENAKFCLLHISVLREYMEHEFEAMKNTLSFPFDLEKIIDDWIVMSFLVGNDFIPHLPNLHIANGALPILYKAYMEILPDLGGYMNEAGTLNLERFEKFMEKLSSIDTEHFAEHQADLRFFECKTGRRVNDHESTNYEYSKETDQCTSPKKSVNKGLEALIKSTDEMLLGHSDEEGDLLDSDSDTEVYNLEFLQHKHDYYMKKFDYECVDADVMRRQAEIYVTAIQWNLHYYYNGCCSWSWYYPHHYAPFISDIKGFKELKLNFQLDKPFLPFQQLLAVLPAASKDLLPEAYRGLLTEEQSPIIDYYPEEFQTDLNEKKQDWEAIVLIPFIDEKRLIDAMHPYDSRLTMEEQKRNRHGPMSVITYVEENLGTVIAPAYFPSIESHAKIVNVERSEIEVPQQNLVKGLCQGIKLSIYFSGFPTLQYIEHVAKLEKCKVKVFEQSSRGENMIISITPKQSPSIENLAVDLLGKIVLIGWPHLLEAYVLSVSNENSKFSLINLEKPYSIENWKKEEVKGLASAQWTSEARDVASRYKLRFGINVGNIDTLIHARPINGRRYIHTSQGRMSLEKQWSSHSVPYAFQAIVRDIEVEMSGSSDEKLIAEVYTPKSICFMLGHPHYGAIGEVNDIGINHKTGRVKVAMVVTPEPDFNKLKAEQHEMQMQYMHGSIAAQRLGISSHLLSRITGSIFVLPRSSEHSERKQQNIGLNLKFTKRNEELPGYTKKVNGQWMYSSKSIGLIRNFMEKFPSLFEKLAQTVGNEIFNEDELFPAGIEELPRVIKWLNEQSFRSVESRNCDWDGLDPDVVEKLEKAVDQFLNENSNGEKTLMMQVKPHLLFMPSLSAGNIPPDPCAKHSVFDRIIAVKENASVPLGYKGTIIYVQGTNGDLNNAYDILFDKPFVGGVPFNGGVKNRRYKLLAAEFMNISHGIRAEQGITGTGQSQERLNWRKQMSPSQNNSQAKSSAFASFNKNGNFFPTFNKEKFHGLLHQQKQQNQQRIRVMNKEKNSQRTDAISLPQNIETKVEQISSRTKHPSVALGQKTSDVQAPSTATPFKKLQNSQSNGTTEFQMLWNELHKLPVPGMKQKANFGQIPPPQVPVPIVTESPQDPSAFLKAVLKISDDKSSESFQSPVPKAKKPFIFPLMPSAPTSTAPALVQQLFDHARQVNRVDNMSYCARMLNHFQLLGIGLPRYFYSSQKNLIRAQIVLPDMRSFYSELCANHELAAENAAKKVFEELNLEQSSKPKTYFNLSPPDAWLNIQPATNVQQVIPPRSFPDAPKPTVRSPSNWNPRMPQLPQGFAQIVAPHIHPVRPTGPVTNKPDKQNTPFVPLQAQKKSRHRNQKEVQQVTVQKTREVPPPSPPPKLQNARPKENVRDEQAIKENDQAKTKDNLASQQKSHKTPRQRRSRIAANFSSSSTAISDDK